MVIVNFFWFVGLLWVLMFAPAANGQQDKTAGAVEWNNLVDAAKKEGKVTVSLPASAEMKKMVEEQFKKRHGIEVETFTARGSSAVRRMADEFKAGVRQFRFAHRRVFVDRLRHARRGHSRSDRAVDGLARSQRSEAVVGRPSVGR